MNGRPTLRWRLTALYGALFFAGGALLLIVNYTLVRSSLPDERIMVRAQVPASEVFVPERGAIGLPVPPPGSEPVIYIDGQEVGTDFIRELPGRLRSSALQDLMAKSLVGLVAVAAASLGFGWWLAGRALQPIHRITDTARRLSETNLDERIALEGPDDELKELADTFDAMLERLDNAFDSQRRFVANASHELRTPLAIMRTQLEVARTPKELAEAAEVVKHVIDRSERLVDALLVLTRADGELVSEDCDLADALTAAAADFGDGDVSVTIDTEPAPVQGDPALLTHLARNLLDNARRYNVPDGWVTARAGADGEFAVLEVSNSGPVVPVDDVESLFEPFRRLAPDRTGAAASAGLGLSIVRAVARAHGGDVSAVSLVDGGLRVEVRMPAVLAGVTSAGGSD